MDKNLVINDYLYTHNKKSIYNLNTDKLVIFKLYNPQIKKINSASLTIYGIKGNIIYANKISNENEIIWDMNNMNNKKIIPGMYIYDISISAKDITVRERGIIIIVK